jgi:hypothetical protein
MATTSSIAAKAAYAATPEKMTKRGVGIDGNI